MDHEKEALINELTELIDTVSGLPECKNVSKRMYSNLVRRVKLLSPLVEEMKDSDVVEVGDDVVHGLELLRIALNSALELLKSVNEGSKIFQVLFSNLIFKCYMIYDDFALFGKCQSIRSNQFLHVNIGTINFLNYYVLLIVWLLERSM